ncbi:uncharacterized protein Dsimw501_GD27313 [Drosophila simulans]|uniref:Uncharacterized protein n=1 Tax=Drosophila simulans TaxID=7240 RepID=A0A0J9UBJ5_DROSI|nr:uncharacterized protein Dsimw501_GD27313 [Drosophila simulans]
MCTHPEPRTTQLHTAQHHHHHCCYDLELEPDRMIQRSNLLWPRARQVTIRSKAKSCSNSSCS